MVLILLLLLLLLLFFFFTSLRLSVLVFHYLNCNDGGVKYLYIYCIASTSERM